MLTRRVVRRAARFLRRRLQPLIGSAAAPPGPAPLPTEFLLPQIRKDIQLEEFPFIRARQSNAEWSDERLVREINRLGHWEYYFPFNNQITTRIHSSFNDDTVNFHRFRTKLISETVMTVLGRDAGDAAVLDLACHCGVFTMDMAHRGVKVAHGFEYREKNVAQARFLKDYYGVVNASFEQGDVYKLASGERSLDREYDVVLCLGLLYHVVQPVDVVELCYRTAKRFAVIETICHEHPYSGYVVVGDKNPEVAIEGTRRIELQPTYRGVIDTMRQVGFRDIVEVVGTCSTRIDLFSDHARRCFLAAKEPGYFREHVTHG